MILKSILKILLSVFLVCLIFRTITVSGQCASCSFNSGFNNNDAFITLRSSTYLNISGSSGHFTNESAAGSASRIDNSGTIKVEGNWYNNADNAANKVFSAATGTVDFSGSNQSVCAGSISTDYANVIISGSGVKSMSRSFSLPSSAVLTLTAGSLALNAQTLSITNTSTGAITRTSGFIRGEVNSDPYGDVKWTIGTGTGSFVYPFATADGTYIPFTFISSTGGDAGAGTISLATYPTAADNTPYPTTVTNVNNNIPADNSANTVDRFWIITPAGYGTAPSATMTFTYKDAEKAANGEDQYDAQRWDNSNGGWQAAVGSPHTFNAAANTVTTTTAVNTFSPWALARTALPLPVEWLSFEAVKIADKLVRMNWKTASEKDCDRFDILRSPDGKTFTPIGKMKGSGNTNIVSKYEFIDENPFEFYNYYRLKQFDFNGDFKFSEIRSVFLGRLAEPSINIFPNPNSGNQIWLNMTGAEPEKEIIIVLTNMLGETVYAKVFFTNENGHVLSVLDPENKLEHGIYFLKAASDRKNEFLSQKIIVE